MRKLIFLLAFIGLNACKSGQYFVSKSPDLEVGEYTHSFAMIADEEASPRLQFFSQVLKKQFIEKKWIYDDIDPDFWVSVAEMNSSHRIRLHLGKSDRRQIKNSGIAFSLQLIDQDNHRSIWRSVVLDLPHEMGERHYTRVASSLLP
ncbi:hypothetical protein LAG90_14960 [Marinilongibacter aquaticus]|uniref:hypothetical protein n=1 Tax=Marinilongibacter aquaticus TaxID=2975157 RepID=UPI0021BDA02D|nr:hypothetical protein [Marinilongibacter aquaticus]UBM58104.1 hypothetical protein LAG90_14960 [Marinilongibacter aquaticus]